MAIKVQVHERGLRRSIEKTVNSVNRRGLRVDINGKQFSRPLGKITGQVSEFNKSLEASNARVLAFGASVGIIYGVQRAFTELAKTVVEVEKAMADINVVMGLSSSKLEDFSQGLFRVAKNTAQSFDEVSKAATEFARQGLTMEETLKRTNDALILVRLTGMDAAEAVKGLTAAINTFSDASLTSTQILDKMAAVDVRFAVSTEDLIDAVSRAGAVAQDAGVNFDQLLGTVTAAQQMTARGGKVIGNSLKTIFTRIQRGSTIDALENLGIAVRDVQGNTLPAIQALKNLSDTYDQVGDAAKSSIAEKVGGVFQINILKALIKDQRNETDLLSRATKVSSNASGEAHRKNILLQKTLHSLGKETVISVKELANTIGQLSLAPGIRDVFDVVKNSSEWLNSALSKDSDDWGSKAAKGFLKGLGKVLTGPGLVLFVGILGKLAGMTMKFLGGSVLEMMKLTSQTQKQKTVQASINQLLSQNMGLQQKLLALSGNKAAQERVILTLLQQQAAAAARVAAVSKSVAPAVVRGGFGSSLRPGKSEGHVPNYVLPQEKIAEKMGAYAGGYRPGKVKAINIPGEGRSVMNTAEKVVRYPGMAQPEIRPPKASPAGRQHRKAFEKTHGFNPYSTGFVPNYALTPNMIAGLRAKLRPGSGATPNEINIAKKKLAEHFAKSGGEGVLDVNAPWSELYAERLARENFGRRNSSGETRFFGKGHVPNYASLSPISFPSRRFAGLQVVDGRRTPTGQKSGIQDPKKTYYSMAYPSGEHGAGFSKRGRFLGDGAFGSVSRISLNEIEKRARWRSGDKSDQERAYREMIEEWARINTLSASMPKNIAGLRSGFGEAITHGRMRKSFVDGRLMKHIDGITPKFFRRRGSDGETDDFAKLLNGNVKDRLKGKASEEGVYLPDLHYGNAMYSKSSYAAITKAVQGLPKIPPRFQQNRGMEFSYNTSEFAPPQMEHYRDKRGDIIDKLSKNLVDKGMVKIVDAGRGGGNIENVDLIKSLAMQEGMSSSKFLELRGKLNFNKGFVPNYVGQPGNLGFTKLMAKEKWLQQLSGGGIKPITHANSISYSPAASPYSGSKELLSHAKKAYGLTDAEAHSFRMWIDDAYSFTHKPKVHQTALKDLQKGDFSTILKRLIERKQYGDTAASPKAYPHGKHDKLTIPSSLDDNTLSNMIHGPVLKKALDPYDDMSPNHPAFWNAKGHVPNYGMRINIPGPSPLSPGYALKQGPQKSAQKSAEKARYTAIKYSGLRDSVLSYGGRKFGIDQKDDYLIQAIKQDEFIRNLAEKRGVKFHEVVNSGRKEDSSFYSRIIPNLKPWKDMEPHVLGRMDYQPKGLIRLPLEEYLSTIKSGKFTSLSNYETLVGKDMGYNQIRGGVTRHLKGGSPPKGSGSFGEHALDWNMIKAHGIPTKDKGFVPNYMPWVPKTIGSLKEHMWSARGGQWRNSDVNSLVQHSLGKGLTKGIKNKIIGTEGYKSFAGELGAIPNVKTAGFYDWLGGLKDKGNAFLPKGLGGTKTSNPIIQDYDSSMISSFDDFVKYASGNQKQAAVSEFFSSKNLSGLTVTSKESGLGWQKATSSGALNLKDSKVWDMLSRVKHETLISHIQQKKGFETIPMYEHGYGSPGSGFSIVPPSQQNTKNDFIHKFYSKAEGSIKESLSRQKKFRNRPSGDIFDVLAKSGRLEDILTKELGGKPSQASLAKAAQAKTQKPQGEAGRIVSMPYGQWRATLGWQKKEGNNIGKEGALGQIDAMRGAKMRTSDSMAIEQNVLARARAEEIAAVEARDISHMYSRKPWMPSLKKLRNKTPEEQSQLIDELRRKHPPPPGPPPPIAFSKLAKMGKSYRSTFTDIEKMEGRHGTTPFPPRDEKAFLESQKRFAAAELKSQQPTVAVTPGSNEPMAMGLSLSSGKIWEKAKKQVMSQAGRSFKKDEKREFDIIDAIKEVSPSGIKTTSGHKYAGELDSVGLLAKGAGRSLRSKSKGETIDQVLAALPEHGYSPGSFDDLWEMIRSASEQRVLAQAALYRGNIENATLTALTSGKGIGNFTGMKDIKTLKESGLKEINSEKLRVGQTFEVRGHPFKVKSFNLENGHLELASLGQGASGSAGSIGHSIRSGESIYIDGGKLSNTQPGQKLGDPFSKGFVPNYGLVNRRNLNLKPATTSADMPNMGGLSDKATSTLLKLTGGKPEILEAMAQAGNSLSLGNAAMMDLSMWVIEMGGKYGLPMLSNLFKGKPITKGLKADWSHSGFVPNYVYKPKPMKVGDFVHHSGKPKPGQGLGAWTQEHANAYKGNYGLRPKGEHWKWDPATKDWVWAPSGSGVFPSDTLLYSGGHVPNYAMISPGASNILRANPSFTQATVDSIKRESAFGVTPQVVAAPQLRSGTNPGLAVVNKEQEGGSLAKARKLHGGLNPKQGKSLGHVPNYSIFDGMPIGHLLDINKAVDLVNERLRANRDLGIQGQDKPTGRFPAGRGGHIAAQQDAMQGFWGDNQRMQSPAFQKELMKLSPELRDAVKSFKALNNSTTAYNAEQARATGGLKAINKDPIHQGYFNKKAIAETLKQDQYKNAGLARALGSSPTEAKIQSMMLANEQIANNTNNPGTKREAIKQNGLLDKLLKDSATTYTKITRSDNQMKEGERKMASAQVRAEDQKALSAIAQNKAIQKTLNTAQQYSGFGKWQDIVRPGLPAQSAGLDKGKTKQLMRTLAQEFGKSQGLRDTRFLMGAQHGGTDPTTKVQRALARDFMKTVQDAGIKSSQGHLASSGYLKGGFFDTTPGSNMKSGGGALYGGQKITKEWNAARDSVYDKTPARKGHGAINKLNQAKTDAARQKNADKRAREQALAKREEKLSTKHGNALKEHSKALTGFNKAVKGGTFIDRIRTRLSKTGLGGLLGGTGEAKAVKASQREAMKTAMTSGSSRMADRMHGNLAAQAAVAAEARQTAKTDAAKKKILKDLAANPKPKMGINYHAGRYASYGNQTLAEIRQQHGMMGAMGAGTQRIGAGTKDFMKNAAKSLGTPRPGMGSMGMGFVLPMIAGYLTPDQGKYERSDYNAESGRFEVNREKGRQNLQPILTGAGMGAMIAGIPGMIVGAGIGWVKAMNDLTLTTKEIAEGMEKNIQRISASVQAADVLMPMVEKRAKASRMGDTVASSRIGSEIRNALMKITDPSIQAEMIGNISSPEAFGKVLEKHSRDLALQQNVSGAMLSMSEGGKRGLSRAGSQIGGIIFQRMDDIDKGLITVRDQQGKERTKESMLKDLKDLSETAAKKNSSGLSSSEIKDLRRRAGGPGTLPGASNIITAPGIGGMILGAAAVAAIAAMVVGTGGLAAAAAPVVAEGALAAGAATGFAPILAGGMMGAGLGAGVGGMIDKNWAQGELKASEATREMFDVIGQLKELGAISEEHAKFLTTAYMDSNLSGLALSKEINKAIERYEKIDDGLKLQSERIFNVNLAYDQLFHKLKKESIRIKEEGRHVGQTTAIRGQAHASFSSTAGEQAEAQRDFAFKKLSISQESTRKSTEVDLRSSYIDWMRKGPMAKLGAPDKVGLVREIERQDRPELKSIAGLTDYFKNDFTYQFDLLKGLDRKSQKTELTLQQDSLSKILKDKSKSNREKEVAFGEDPKFKGIVNTGGIEAYKKRIDQLLKDLEALPDGQALGEGVAVYEREIKLNKKNLENLEFKDKQLQDQLKLIKEANENAQTELRLQTEINIAKGKMLTHIGVLNSKFSLGLSEKQLTLGEEKGSLSLDKNFLKNTQEEPFRYNNESKQFESQQKLMEGVQSEEHKIRKAENLIQAKEEIQRFLSNEKLIYSLDNLRGQVDELSAAITGSKPDDTASFALSGEEKSRIQEQTKKRIEEINRSTGVTKIEEKLAGVRAHNKALGGEFRTQEGARQADIKSGGEKLANIRGMLVDFQNVIVDLGNHGGSRFENAQIEKKAGLTTTGAGRGASTQLAIELLRGLTGEDNKKIEIGGKSYKGWLDVMSRDLSSHTPSLRAGWLSYEEAKEDKPAYRLTRRNDAENTTTLQDLIGRAIAGIEGRQAAIEEGRQTTPEEKKNFQIAEAILKSLNAMGKDRSGRFYLNKGDVNRVGEALSMNSIPLKGIDSKVHAAFRSLENAAEVGKNFKDNLDHSDNPIKKEEYRNMGGPLESISRNPINTTSLDKELAQAKLNAEEKIKEHIDTIINQANTKRQGVKLEPLQSPWSSVRRPTGRALIDKLTSVREMQARSTRQVAIVKKVNSSVGAETGGFDVSNFEKELGNIDRAKDAKELEDVLSELVDAPTLQEGMKNGLKTLINRLKLIRENLERTNKQEILELMTRRQTYEDSMMSSALFRPQMKESSGILNLSRGEKFDGGRINESINAMGVGTDIAAFNQWSQSARQYEAINASSTSTDLEKASARSLISGVTYSAGMELNQDGDGVQRMQQRQRFNSLADAEEWNKNNMEVLHSKRTDAQRSILEARNEIAEKFKDQELTKEQIEKKEDEDSAIQKAKETLKDIDDLLEELGGSLKRHVPRDDGFGKEFMTNMSRGLGVGFAEVQSQAEEIYTKLGVQLPHALRDGLTDAMMLAVEGADELGDRLKEIGTGFLKIIQRAFLESAASRVVGALGLNSGGKVVGGSGVKDDVPAVLTGGEYVINRRSAQMYGYGFLEKLNRGEAQGFARGGAVNMNITAGRAQEREEYTDENKKYGDVTKYKAIKEGRAIDRRMSGFAIDNDPLIAKMFKDQESQFGEDLRTKEMLKDREKAKKQAKKNRKHMLLQLAAAAGIAYTVKKVTAWAQKTKTYKKWSGRKFERRARRELDAGRGVEVNPGGKSPIIRHASDKARANEMAQLEKLYDHGRGESDMLKYAHRNGIRLDYSRGSVGRMPGNPYASRPPTFREQVKVYNSGGSVPTQANSLLTGGEFVMGSSAVNKYGTGFMSRLNSGSVSRHSEGGLVGSSGGSASNTNNDINITVNVDKSGGTQDTEVAGNSANEEKILAKKIKTAVLDVINDQRRVGGSLRG